MSELKKTIEQSFTQYAGSVLQSRALIDVRDALKPSARQIFYCMDMCKYTHNKPFVKTQAPIGDAMKYFYVHGDSSCEGIIMRAGQPFAMRYPLVDVKGNGGSLIATGNWAAPRYTDCRLSELSSYLFEDIKKDTIPEWRDNYADTDQYPSVLPSKGFYNLVNGTMGIGIGMASSVPQFNIRDLNNALIHLIQHPNCDFEDIYCPPDFATGGLLINEKEVKESLKNGTGSACKLRSIIDYDVKDNCLVVKEIPYGVYTNTICKQLEEIEQSEENPGIERHNDLTGKSVNIKIYLHKNANPDRIIRFLYKNTSLQDYFGINLTMLDNGRFPKVFTWKECLQAHINHEKDVYRRGFEFDLKEIKTKIHIIKGLLICLAQIEEVVQTIKQSASIGDALKALMTQFLLDEEQANAVLKMTLSRLASLEVQKLKDQKAELEKEAARIEKILNDENLLNKELIDGWTKVINQFADDRRTRIIEVHDENQDKDIEDVAPEDCIIILTKGGTIKRIPSAAFKLQKRNGKGIKTQEDITSMIIRTNTVDSLMIFSTVGKMYRLLVDDIPEGTNASKGLSVKALVNMADNEEPSVIYSIYRDTDAKYVLFVTKQGLIKKTPLAEYIKTKKKNGINAITFRGDDSLATVTLIKDEPISIITQQGYVLKFDSNELAPTSRIASGVKAINLGDGDLVTTAVAIRDSNDALALFSKNGNGKKILPSESLMQKRGGKGLKCYKGTDIIVAAALVSDEDKVLIVGNRSSICINAAEIPALGRNSIGNIMLKGNMVLSVSKV